MPITWNDLADFTIRYVILFPLFLLALNSVLQVATRAICRQFWKTKWEMTNKGN